MAAPAEATIIAIVMAVMVREERSLSPLGFSSLGFPSSGPSASEFGGSESGRSVITTVLGREEWAWCASFLPIQTRARATAFRRVSWNRRVFSIATREQLKTDVFANRFVPSDSVRSGHTTWPLVRLEQKL
jgi:hypothetical protein